MSDAPERIWANPYYGVLPHQTSGIWKTTNPQGNGVEYTRADLVASLIEAATIFADGYEHDDKDKALRGFYAVQAALKEVRG